MRAHVHHSFGVALLVPRDIQMCGHWQLFLILSFSFSSFPLPYLSSHVSDSLHCLPVDRQPLCSNTALHCVVADAAGQTAVEPLYTEVYVSNRGVQQHVCQLV